MEAFVPNAAVLLPFASVSVSSDVLFAKSAFIDGCRGCELSNRIRSSSAIDCFSEVDVCRIVNIYRIVTFTGSDAVGFQDVPVIALGDVSAGDYCAEVRRRLAEVDTSQNPTCAAAFVSTAVHSYNLVSRSQINRDTTKNSRVVNY